MKKASLCFLTLILLGRAFSQDADAALPKIVGDTLFTTSGYKIAEGQELTFGKGTMPDGDFKYARISRNSLFGYTGNDQSKVNAANSLNRRFSGQHFKVVKVDKIGNKKHGYNYLAFVKVGLERIEVDADLAIESGEIVVPSEFRPKAPTNGQQISVADELMKLKKLYEDSVLTKDEYETQKKKLLEKN
jgi:hypothetical protein